MHQQHIAEVATEVCCSSMQAAGLKTLCSREELFSVAVLIRA